MKSLYPAGILYKFLRTTAGAVREETRINRKRYTGRNAGTFMQELSVAAGILGACALMPATAMAQQCPIGGPNLVGNPGFEAASLAPWVLAWPNPPDLFSHVTTAFPHSGTHSFTMGAVPGLNSLSQHISRTVCGCIYTVSFWLIHPDNTGPDLFTVRWNSQPIMELVDIQDFPYTHYKFSVRATGNDTLRFDEQEVPAFFFLDDVSVVSGGTTPFAPSGSKANPPQ